MNGVPTGFVKFVNQLSMVSFGALNSQVVWFIGSVVLTGVDAYLLTRRATEIPLSQVGDALHASMAATVFLSHNTAAEQMRQAGIILAGLLLTAWTGKSITNAVANQGARRTSREWLEGQAKVEEAKERGRVAGAATAEHAALPTVKVEAKDQATVKVEAPPTAQPNGPEDQATEHNRLDDERGE